MNYDFYLLIRRIVSLAIDFAIGICIMFGIANITADKLSSDAYYFLINNTAYFIFLIQNSFGKKKRSLGKFLMRLSLVDNHTNNLTLSKSLYRGALISLTMWYLLYIFWSGGYYYDIVKLIRLDYSTAFQIVDSLMKLFFTLNVVILLSSSGSTMLYDVICKTKVVIEKKSSNFILKSQTIVYLFFISILIASLWSFMDIKNNPDDHLRIKETSNKRMILSKDLAHFDTTITIDSYYPEMGFKGCRRFELNLSLPNSKFKNPYYCNDLRNFTTKILSKDEFEYWNTKVIMRSNNDLFSLNKKELI